MPTNTMKHNIALLAASLLLSACATTTPDQKPNAISGTKAYPLDTCIVTDNDLGSMGDEQRITHAGREIKFCCAPCVDKFLSKPAKYLAKLP
jgi:hypothetical protein